MPRWRSTAEAQTGGSDVHHHTPLDRLRAALKSGGTIPPDLIEPLRDLLGQLGHATGAADRAAEHYPDAAEVAKRSRTARRALTWFSTPTPGSGALWRAPPAADPARDRPDAPPTARRSGVFCCHGPGAAGTHSIEAVL